MSSTNTRRGPRRPAAERAAGNLAQAAPGRGNDTAESASWLGELETPPSNAEGVPIDMGTQTGRRSSRPRTGNYKGG